MSDTVEEPRSTEPEPDRSAGETFLSVRNLKKYYESGGLFAERPVKAVDGVSFDIQRGETLALVGESGCGKTTLGRTLLQLETPTDGRVSVDLEDGERLAGTTDVTELGGADLRAWQRNAQMVFQDPDSSLNERMTVGELIREPLDAHGWKTFEDRENRVFELLEKVGLQEEHFYRYPHQFSGGQLQRIAIARSLALKPDFLVLDEPVSALDVSVQARIINLLEELQAELNLTYLFIAHDLSVVRHIADRVAVMYLGNVVELGPAESVFTDPAHPYTVSLLSAIPGSRVGTDAERITLRGTPPSPRDPPSGCAFSTRCPAKIRPEEHRDLPEAAWEGIDTFYAVLRERRNRDVEIADRVKAVLGMDETGREIDEVMADLFDDVGMDGDARRVVDEAAELAREGDDAAAAGVLDDEFGSVCSDELPEHHTVDADGRQSLCHRHREEYEAVGTTITRRRQRR